MPISKTVLRKLKEKEKEYQRGIERLRVQRSQLIARVDTLEVEMRHLRSKSFKNKRRCALLKDENQYLKMELLELRRVVASAKRAQPKAAAPPSPASFLASEENALQREDATVEKKTEKEADDSEEYYEEDYENEDGDEDGDEDDDAEKYTTDDGEDDSNRVTNGEPLKSAVVIDAPVRVIPRQRKVKKKKQKKGRPASAGPLRSRFTRSDGLLQQPPLGNSRLHPSLVKQSSISAARAKTTRPSSAGAASSLSRTKASPASYGVGEADFDRLLQRDRLYIQKLVEEQRERKEAASGLFVTF